jgi:hypothetical protein
MYAKVAGAAFAVLLVLLFGPNLTAKANVRECQMDALKTFGMLRKPNEHGIYWPPHELERDFISYCMAKRGFALESRPELAKASVEERALHMGNPDSWKWDYARLLPRFARDAVE